MEPLPTFPLLPTATRVRVRPVVALASDFAAIPSGHALVRTSACARTGPVARRTGAADRAPARAAPFAALDPQTSSASTKGTSTAGAQGAPMARAFEAGMRLWSTFASPWASRLRGSDLRVERLLHDERAARARNLARARDPFHRERLQRDWNFGYDGFRGW
jgi:hypothetical protein